MPTTEGERTKVVLLKIECDNDSPCILPAMSLLAGDVIFLPLDNDQGDDMAIGVIRNLSVTKKYNSRSPGDGVLRLPK